MNKARAFCEIEWPSFLTAFVRCRRLRSHAVVKRDGQADGAVRQAFQGALRKELADFYKLLASLEAQTENAMPEPNSTGEAPTSYLTLRRLLVWLGEPLVRLLPSQIHM